MAKFEIKSFRGGKSDYNDRGLFGSYQASKNLDIHGLDDILTCNYALITDGNAGSIVTDLINFFVNGTDGNLYGFGDTGKIYKRTPSAVWSVVYTDPDGEITGALEFPLDNNKSYLWWTTSTKLHEKELPGNTGWTDVDTTITGLLSGTPQTFPKTNLTAATWHSMANADGALMICNKYYLAMVGFDGTYTNSAVTLRPGSLSKAITEYGRMVLAGGGDGVQESHLFTWEAEALSWIDKNKIPEPTINAIVKSELMLMSAGTNGLYYSDMVNTLPISIVDGQANPGGVVEKGGLALFGFYGGSWSGLWSYGRIKKNESHVLNLEAYLDADEIGAICKVSGQPFISYQKGATHAVRKVDTATKAVAEYYSLVLSAPKESVWHSIDLETGTIPSGCSIAVYYDLDSTGSWTQAKMAGDIALATATMRDPTFLVGSYGRAIEVKIVLTPNSLLSPQVANILVNFE